MSTKTGRNEPCLCGSGRKFKKCHGRIAHAGPTDAQIRLAIDRTAASQRIRQNQQGLGRPIISANVKGHQFVAVGKKLYHSSTWKTFSDFLSDYVKTVLDPAWGNAEIAKPFEQRHPIMRWYDAFCRYQKAVIREPGRVHSYQITGVVACFLGLAYDLYLIEHNVELQSRLVRRLKDVRQFQGAYYELIVANILIRAGFDLTLEDEEDGASKHCEFAAVSKQTGKRYWVEAKMRSVAGLLGKTAADGTNDPNPLSRLIPHLNDALAKPAADERLIFIDLNTELDKPCVMPAWGERAAKRLEQYEAKELADGCRAYVFVTNVAFHRALDRDDLGWAALPFGLGMPDFNRPGYKRLSEAYLQKLAHIDAHRIGEAFNKYLQWPRTFDGRLASEAFHGSQRILIGETYRFPDGSGGEVVGTVTAATVNEPESKVYFAISDEQGNAKLLSQPMTAEELADYKANADAYFGRIQPVSRKVKNEFELFEWLMDTHKSLTREVLLERLASFPNQDSLKAASTEGLLAMYCESMAAGMLASGTLKCGGGPG